MPARFQTPTLPAALVLLLLLCAAPAPAQETDQEEQESQAEPAPLSERHRRWLEEEVVYIISNVERNALLELATEEERERFVEAFWAVRDPTPGTERNEFRDEHYERIRQANRLYGRDTSRQGWMTDRGRLYILLGEPRFRSQYPEDMLIYPTDLWHYIGVNSYGLPPSFYLIFFRPYGVGEMRLYRPTSDGVEKLVRPLHSLSTMNPERLTEVIFRDVDPELAHAVWSLNPSEGGLADLRFTPNPLASEMLLARITDARNYPRNYEWVNNWMAQRTAVRVEYVFEGAAARTLFTWLQNPSGRMEMHYAISLLPEQFALGRYRDRVYGSVTLDGYLTTMDGDLVAPMRHHSEFNVSPEQVSEVSRRPFEFQGLLPVIPGAFQLTLLFKNDVSRRGMPVIAELEVPDLEALEVPVFSPPLLVSSRQTLEEGEATHAVRPFQVGSNLLTPMVAPIVAPGTHLNLFAQLVMPPGHPLAISEHNIEFRIRRQDEVIHRESVPLSNYAVGEQLQASIGILQTIQTSGIPAGNYSVSILLLRGEEEIARGDGPAFTIGGELELGPWIIRRGVPPYTRGYHALARAEQWMRRGELARASELLREAVELEPSRTEARITLMRMLLRERRFEEIIELGEPVAIEQPRNVELLILLASGYMGGERIRDAVRLLERVLTEESDNLSALNLLAHASLAAGDLERALEAAESSLAIYPEQPSIVELKEQIEALQD